MIDRLYLALYNNLLLSRQKSSALLQKGQTLALSINYFTSKSSNHFMAQTNISKALSRLG